MMIKGGTGDNQRWWKMTKNIENDDKTIFFREKMKLFSLKKPLLQKA